LPAEETRQRVGEILALTQLSGKEQRRIQTLSGGEQQRVALARSLVTNPSLLLLDEPLGALDLKLRREMAAELKRLHRHLNMTFLYVTHDQEEALSMSDTVIVMHAGTIRQIGTPAELYWRPRTTFVADFLGGANVLFGTVMEGGNGVVKVRIDDGADQTMVKVTGGCMRVGDPVALAVRGERIAFGSEAEGKDNRLSGILQDVRFYGSLTELEIRLASGQTLRVRRGGLTETRGCVISEAVRVGWNAEEAIIVNRD
jgi:ABC-type Fe3+/spermidine/putrescine transport system ATPase subunit